MKKFILVAAVILFIFFSYSVYSFISAEDSNADIVAHYNEQWNLKLEIPGEIEYLWSPSPSFNGDGTWYSLLLYDQEIKSPKNMGLTLVTEENIETFRQELGKFIAEEISASSSTVGGGIEDAFARNPVEVNVGDYYIRRSKNRDYNIFIAIYPEDSKEVLILQSNM